MDKGQTALEYLLIVVVAIMVVAAVLFFMQGQTSNTSTLAGSRVDATMCRSYTCDTPGSVNECEPGTTNDYCAAGTACGPDNYCEPS